MMRKILLVLAVLFLVITAIGAVIAGDTKGFGWAELFVLVCLALVFVLIRPTLSPSYVPPDDDVL